MTKAIDITGQKFGCITILKRVENDSQGRTQFLYKCNCGKEKIGRGKDIRNGKIISCGCTKGKTSAVDITGQQFNLLKAVKYEYSQKDKQYWSFLCDCGQTTIKPKHDVMLGKIKSCGCKTRLWQSQSQRTYLPNGAIYNFLQIVKPITSMDELGDTKYQCKCLLCGTIVDIVGSQITSGHKKSCGCLHSYAEAQIKQILLNNNINFKKEYCFLDLFTINNTHPRFDFAIIKNKKILGCIEYQGEQHFLDKGYFGKLQREETDKIKYDYCLQKQIPLLILTKDSKLESEILNFIKIINYKNEV